jgi:cytochrome c peroxidase
MFKNVRLVQRERLTAMSCLTVLACGGSAAELAEERELGKVSQAVNFASATTICNSDPRVELGLVSQDICVGAELFFRDEFGGNGRSCASCHPASNNFTIDAEFIDSLPNNDPLFVAENDEDLAGLERPDLLREFGLILENVDGAEDPTNKFTLRSVPHCLSLSRSIQAPEGTTTPPLERTGWSGDGAPNDGRLRDFQTGAIFQHYTKSLARVSGTDFTPATSDELDAIDEFLKTIGRMNEVALSTVTLTDAGANSGRTTFTSAAARCNGCHSNAGANLANGVNQNFDTGVERLRLAELNTQGIPFDGGFGGGGLSSFNFDSNGDGTLDSFGNGQFNTPPVIEAADTGPFFHTNAFETIEDAVEFYNTSAFNQSPAGQAGTAINLTATQIANIGRFLRVINASFNVQMAIARTEAVAIIADEEGNASRELQQELAGLAVAELKDALEVLEGVAALNVAAQNTIRDAKDLVEIAETSSSAVQRRNAAEDALDELDDATVGLGTGLTFNMGQGTLMF